MSLRATLLSSIAVVCYTAAIYDPPGAGNALDAIESALVKIVKNPHLTAAQLSSAKVVTSSVEKTVAELESPKGKLLSKEAKASKVNGAIKELQGLQDAWQNSSTQLLSQKKADLAKQLSDKEGELAKDMKMLKVINLEKALAEKKLALEKLVEMKNAQAQGSVQMEAQKEAAAQQELVANVLNMAKSLQTAQGKNVSMSHAADKLTNGKPAMLKAILMHLQDRMQNVTASLDKLDAAEKRNTAKIQGVLGMKAPVNGSNDAIGKGQSMLTMLMKKEHRQFEKARAPLKNEYKELSEAVSSISKGDAAGLTKVMGHMQGEMKSLEAKSHKFLY